MSMFKRSRPIALGLLTALALAPAAARAAENTPGLGKPI